MHAKAAIPYSYLSVRAFVAPGAPGLFYRARWICLLVFIRILFSAGIAAIAAALMIYFSDQQVMMANRMLQAGIRVDAQVTDLRVKGCSRHGSIAGSVICAAWMNYHFKSTTNQDIDGHAEFSSYEASQMAILSSQTNLLLMIPEAVVDVPFRSAATVKVIYLKEDPAASYPLSSIESWSIPSPLMIFVLFAMLWFGMFYLTGMLAAMFLGVPQTSLQTLRERLFGSV